MPNKELFGLLSTLAAFVGYAPYVWGVAKGKTKPHVFTWVIWSLTTGIVATAQYKAGAGAGVWATGFTCLVSLIILALAFRRGEKNIVRSDWLSFLGALAAIPFWYLTDDPLIAVVLISAIDGAAYLPTFRKSVPKPYEELMWFYVLSTVKHSFILLAMQRYSLTTVLYSSTLISMNILLLGLLLWQRRVVKKPARD